MSKDLEVRFFKLKTQEDIVAYLVDEDDEDYSIQKPLIVSIENDFSTGRQMVDIREWIPPVICSSDTTKLPKEMVLIKMDVLDTFKVEYVEAANFFYSVEPIKKTANTKNILPFAIKDTSNKPN